jgi:hypothetical protein
LGEIGGTNVGMITAGPEGLNRPAVMKIAKGWWSWEVLAAGEYVGQVSRPDEAYS